MRNELWFSLAFYMKTLRSFLSLCGIKLIIAGEIEHDISLSFCNGSVWHLQKLLYIITRRIMVAHTL